MLTDTELVLLERLANEAWTPPISPKKRVDISSLAPRIDIHLLMEEVRGICEEGHHVGGHVRCTRMNVLPHYDQIRRLEVDHDHYTGLLAIVAVGRGRRPDY